MSLTNTAIRNVKPGNKPIRLFDQRGLYLEVLPTGSKWWRLKFRFEGKEKRLALGVYRSIHLGHLKRAATRLAMVLIRSNCRLSLLLSLSWSSRTELW